LCKYKSFVYNSLSSGLFRCPCSGPYIRPVSKDRTTQAVCFLRGQPAAFLAPILLCCFSPDTNIWNTPSGKAVATFNYDYICLDLTRHRPLPFLKVKSSRRHSSLVSSFLHFDNVTPRPQNGCSQRTVGTPAYAIEEYTLGSLHSQE